MLQELCEGGEWAEIDPHKAGHSVGAWLPEGLWYVCFYQAL